MTPRDSKSQVEAAYVAHGPMMLAHARRFLGGDAAGAADAVHDAMEKYLISFPDGAPGEPGCGGWLMKTLTGCLIDGFRHLKVVRGAEGDPTLVDRLFPPPPPPPDKRDLVMDLLTHDHFRRAVNAMSRAQREVYDLHVLGHDHQAIAAKLKISTVASRKRLHDARLVLKEQLRPYLEVES